jgi:hypothetical protein
MIILSQSFPEIKKREFLYRAIEESQNTIRFTDTKAGAIFVLGGIVFAFIATLFKDLIAFYKKLYDFFPNNHYDVLIQSILILIFLFGMGLIYLSIMLSIKAIAPKSGQNGSINVDIHDKIIPIFYLKDIIPVPNFYNLFNDKAGAFKLNTKFTEIDQDLAVLDDTNLKNLLIVELQTVSAIRELKLQRVSQSFRFFKWGINLLLLELIIVFVITVYS